jgi:hypothetical protein
MGKQWQPYEDADDQALQKRLLELRAVADLPEASARCAYSTSSHGATAKMMACESRAVKHDQLSPRCLLTDP